MRPAFQAGAKMNQKMFSATNYVSQLTNQAFAWRREHCQEKSSNWLVELN
jgi:hypothetical protein